MNTRESPRPVPHVVHAAPARHTRHVDLDAGDAFVPDYRHGLGVLLDGDAEALGEEFIASATSAEAVAESARDEFVQDELDGLSIDTPDEDADE